MKTLLLLFVATLIVTADAVRAEARPGAPPAEVELEMQAEIAYDKNNPAEALVLYQKLVAMNKNQLPEVFLQIANCQSKLGKFQESITTYNGAMKSTMEYYKEPDPKRSEQVANVFRARAQTYFQAAHTKEALADFRRTAALDPKDAYAISKSAWILATSADPALRDPKEALTLAQKAIKMAANIEQLDALAAALAANGKFAEAIEQEKAVIAKTDDEDDEKKDFQARLKSYQQNKAFIDTRKPK